MENDALIVEEWGSYVKELGINLQRVRMARKLSQEQVAYGARLSRLQYQRLEWGISSPSPKPSNPTLKSLIAIAQVLECSLGDIIPDDWPDLRAR